MSSYQVFGPLSQFFFYPLIIKNSYIVGILAFLSMVYGENISPSFSGLLTFFMMVVPYKIFLFLCG